MKRSQKKSKVSSKHPDDEYPYQTAWLIDRVRAAGPVAVYLLGHGLADEAGDLVYQLQKFAGDVESIENKGDSDRVLDKIINWITQAYAVGIAVGQRLQPGAFNTDGGAR